MNRYILLDGPNIAHAMSGTRTKLKVGEQEVQGIYNFLRLTRKVFATYGLYKPIVLWDGRSWRKNHFADYKENRDKNDTAAAKKVQVERESAKSQIPIIRKALQLLGVPQIKAVNMEADDLAAIVGDRYVAQGAKVVLITGDKDWIQLVGPSISWFDPVTGHKIASVKDLQETKGYRVKDFRQFVEMKALMGDIGDNIPGVGGVGEKGAQELLDSFGSFAAFSNDALHMTAEELKQLPKKFRDLVTDETKRIAFARNIELMDLRTTARPAPMNLVVDHGEPSAERFGRFCRMLLFKSIYADPHWIEAFPAFREQQVAA